MSSLTDTAAWRALQERAHASQASQETISGLFERDPSRARRYSAEACGLFLDYSKQRVDDKTLGLLLALAEQQDVSGWISRLFSGDPINLTEGRAAMHMALRAPPHEHLHAAGVDVSPLVQDVLARMAAFADSIRSGAYRGVTGETITDVVNIGIGGSDLGPRMVSEALPDCCDGPHPHYVANVDGAQLASVLEQVRPSRTLFIVTSKTFTTLETMANARAARRWLTRALGDEAVGQHFVAVSTNLTQVQRFGIAPERMFEFWDWVGGRYSVWSAVGLPLMISLGPERYAEWLDGAHAMDRHFCEAPPERNLPLLMALLAVWNHNFLGAGTQVVAPYAQRLQRFVAWLQQLEMESNGKGVHRDGSPVQTGTTPAIWGDVGTNAQHAFFQMLHQGPQAHPVDFILPVKASHPWPEQQRALVANCLAQSAALMKGKSAAQVRAELAAALQGEALEQAIPHRVFPGNRPSNTLLMPALDPRHLGALMALYEHRTFTLSVLWNINAFDQWGVELGKSLAQSVLKAMEGEPVELDASTLQLLNMSLTL